MTTCTIGKITDSATAAVLWGRGCGAANNNLTTATSSVCQPYTAGTASGQLCTCSTSVCNGLVSGAALIARAELGFSGTGLQCYLCTGGTSGQYLCASSTDPGTAIDCGTGVATCRLGKTTAGGVIARGCGAAGAPAVTGCQQSSLGTACTCSTSLCNSVAATASLLALAATTNPQTNSAAATISVLSLNQVASLVAGAVLNATLSNATVDLPSLIAASLPAGAAGGCAYLLDGRVVALTPDGLQAYSTMMFGSSVIAAISPCEGAAAQLSVSCCCLWVRSIIMLLLFTWR